MNTRTFVERNYFSGHKKKKTGRYFHLISLLFSFKKTNLIYYYWRKQKCTGEIDGDWGSVITRNA